MSRTNAPPSLVKLCIKTAVNNLSHIRDVGDTDIHLLKEILNKCTPDQLTQIEIASKDRDLRSVTEGLWHQFYIQKFGVESANQLGTVVLNWRQIYEDKSKELTILVSTNTSAVVNRTAATPGPGCLRKSLDQIKKVCETLLKIKIPCGIVRCIRSNAENALVIFIVVVFIIIHIGVFGIIIKSMVNDFIKHAYVGAISLLLFVVFVVVFEVGICISMMQRDRW